MKNLHLLETDKPSTLFKDNFGRYFISINIDQEQNHFKPQHIYITSDEEIKDDEWHLHYYEGKPVISKSHNGASEYINLKAKDFGYEKIILTTDQDLIADGVQAIDDEFLEWFEENKKNNMKQTSVEWLFEQLWETPKDKLIWNTILSKAKEMEKEQIMEAHNQGYADGYRDNGNSPIDYYNETFKSE